MFEEFESDIKELKNKYDSYKNRSEKYNKNLFNHLDQPAINIISNLGESSLKEDIKNGFNEISSDEKILKDIYLYQFENPQVCENKLDDPNDVLLLIINTIKKFQWVVGGYLIEDPEWLIEKKNSKRFKINENEMILSNTLNYLDDATELFMENLIKYVNNFVDKDKIQIRFKIKDDELLDLTFIVIFVKHLVG